MDKPLIFTLLDKSESVFFTLLRKLHNKLRSNYGNHGLFKYILYSREPLVSMVFIYNAS